MLYKALRKGLISKPIFYPINEIGFVIGEERNINPEELYVSLYNYTEDHINQFEEKGTVAGIKDTTTDCLFFDFDSKKDMEQARKDALELCYRLVDQSIPEDAIQVSFSGNKGYGVKVNLEDNITPKQFKEITNHLAKGLNTFDTVVSDPNRIVRVTNSINAKSGLYKIPLELYELESYKSDDIKLQASKPREIPKYACVPLPEPLKIHEESKELKVVVTQFLDKKDQLDLAMKDKPANWKDYKWALVQGFFESGERHNALMIVAATCRGLRLSKELAYYYCKHALEKQAEIYGDDKFDKKEVWENIIEKSVYSDTWEGGQYSPKTNEWLKVYCEKWGFKLNDDEEKPCIEINDMSKHFHKYASEFEKNIVRMGLPSLDNNCLLLAGTSNGLVGAPGSSKTTLSLNFLENNSRMGNQSLFLSMDMAMPIIYSKLIQRELGIAFKQAQSLYMTNPKEAQRLDKLIAEKYKNVGFNFKSGLTPADIRNIIKDRENKTGQKIRFLVIDYLECLNSDFSDTNASQAYIANQIKDIATEMEICCLTLLQTQKHSTPDPSDALLSLRAVKGTSVLEQSFSTLITIWREGYSPKTVNDDNYLSMAIVKNRFGSLWSHDYHWDGPKGHVRELTDEERFQLKDFKQRKAEMRADVESSWK